MTSEIRVDTSKNASGLCTVTYSNTGAVLSGITTGTFSGSGASLTTLNGSNISSGTVATARLGSGTASSSTFLRGDGSWASNTSTTINSNADNRIITGSGTANTLNGESNFTYDGDEVAIYAQTDDTDCILHLVGKTASGGVGQAGRTAIIAESTHNSNGRSSMHLRTRNTSNAQIIGMTIDGNQNVGIGTQLPDNRLEIYKGSAGTYLKAGGDNSNNARALTFTSSATSNSIDGGKHTINASSAHGELALATTGSEAIHINKDGKVRVGSGSATYNLEVQTTGFVETLIGSTNAGGAGIILDGDSNGDGSGGDYAQIFHKDDGTLNFRSRNGDGGTDTIFLSNTTETLRIDSDGRLLFGKTSSTLETSLVLCGNSNSYTTNPGVLQLEMGNTPSNLGSLGVISFGSQDKIGARIDGRADQDWTLASARGTHLRFLTCDNDTTQLDERLRITNDGKFGFNDTSPERTIDVKGSNCMIQLEGTGGNGRQYSLCSSDDTTGTAVDGGPSGTFAIYDDTAGAARLRITSGGVMNVASQPSFSIRTVDANSFGTSSSHYALSYASPLPIFTSGNVTTEHHVGSVLTYHDYVAGSNTGRYVKFTAPVAGNYLFGINAECNVAADDWVGFGFEINNSGTHNATLERLVAWTHNQSAEDGSAQSRRRSFQASCLIRLAASDYVVPYQQSSSTSTMQNTFRIWGMLVN